MALQPGLGLLPERRARVGSSNSHHLAPVREVLIRQVLSTSQLNGY